jgi:hypothetical protein
VPSAFQLVTVAVVLRNILNPCFATFSATSRKSEQRCVFDLARNSSTRRCPMLKPLQTWKQEEINSKGSNRGAAGRMPGLGGHAATQH